MLDRPVELTIRGLAIGAAITLLFTAANVYAGLKVGLTFATSIPAAVISMAVLRAVKTSTIWENNVVQTVASSAGTLSSVIFVLPGLVMIGTWSGFPFWETFSICAVGGILGVMYSVPLRRALVTASDLPYPEGVAAAEVLRVGTGGLTAQEIEHQKSGMNALVTGSLASAGFAVLGAMRLFRTTLAGYVRVGAGATGMGFGLSLLLVGAGHLIGLSVGLAILAGLVIAWGIATPVLTALHPMAGSVADVAQNVFSNQVRFVGAGTIGVAALWTLGRLAGPVVNGLRGAMASSRVRARGEGASLDRTEHDIPIGIVALVIVSCLVPLGILLAVFLAGTPLAPSSALLVAIAIVYIVVAGFFVAAACGYMAGLIGSSNSPVSGLAILAVLGIALLMLLVVGHGNGPGATATIAYALFVTAVLLCIATISNDNLQDLKTGQLVDATPWKQQVALIVGVVFGAAVIPPVLDLLNHAYGFGAGPNALPAPQATLISALAKGVIAGHIDWGLIGAGALVGIVLIAIDEGGRAMKWFALPPLAVGLGIYLPPSTTAPVVLGAILGYLYNRWCERAKDPERAKQLGVLTASGMIVGESLFGVVLAGLVVFTKRDNPLAVVGDAFGNWSLLLGVLGFIATVAGLYWWNSRLATRSSTGSR
ncbi:MAG: oligopeptide transporter, OPT family [Candidatus Eremiobacteraeota bacterium]|nr:oligopeptide transporter, OPT family [Candidatus Eremiobacteraeota bacterium]